MGNPWKDIDLNDYEAHMGLDSVLQLQTMNRMMKEQFSAYPVSSVMILGIAGGNGLEHIGGQGFRKVYGVDINETYLQTCVRRYPALQGVLETVCADLTREAEKLPHAELLVANLLIEYIGYQNFQEAVLAVKPKYVSCAIQVNTDESFVSDSPYLHVFDWLEEVHHQMEEHALSKAMHDVGYRQILREKAELPNGKKLLRLDFGC